MSSDAGREAVAACGWVRSVLTGALRSLTKDPDAVVAHPAPDVIAFTMPSGARVSLRVSVATREGAL